MAGSPGGCTAARGAGRVGGPAVVASRLRGDVAAPRGDRGVAKPVRPQPAAGSSPGRAGLSPMDPAVIPRNRHLPTACQQGATRSPKKGQPISGLHHRSAPRTRVAPRGGRGDPSSGGGTGSARMDPAASHRRWTVMPSPQPARRSVDVDPVAHRAAQVEIERLRRMLYRMARRHGCSDPAVLDLSRRLDALIVGWYRAHRGGEAPHPGPATTAS
ncbi:MAG: hypothetical protein DIU76_09160 [Bacillota bacterium]|nr:MAG: hypothetical protein DIU76_09160 [Bacillota bacterium]